MSTRVLVATLATSFALAACVSSSNSPSPTANSAPDAGIPFDASVPIAFADGSTPSAVDAGSADVSVAPPTDAAPADAPVDIDAATDAAPADAGIDVGADAGPPDADAAVDAALVAYPDAGTNCTAPTETSLLSPAAAGLPTSGLTLWLRGDHGVYTATSDGGSTVCAWADQSGNGWLFQTPAAAVLPSFTAAGVGSQPAVVLASGASMGLSGVLGMAPTSPRTFVAVESLIAAGGRFNPIIQGQSTSSSEFMMIDSNTWETAGQLEGVYITNNSLDSTTATSAATARVHVFTVLSMVSGTPLASAIDYRVDGVTQTLNLRAGAGTIGDFSAADFTAMGPAGASSTGVAASGMVAEVVVYDRALDVTERASVESALMTRYGIH